MFPSFATYLTKFLPLLNLTPNLILALTLGLFGMFDPSAMLSSPEEPTTPSGRREVESDRSSSIPGWLSLFGYGSRVIFAEDFVMMAMAQMLDSKEPILME